MLRTASGRNSGCSRRSSAGAITGIALHALSIQQLLNGRCTLNQALSTPELTRRMPSAGCHGPVVSAPLALPHGRLRRRGLLRGPDLFGDAGLLRDACLLGRANLAADPRRLGVGGRRRGEPLLERVGPQAVGDEPGVVQEAARLALVGP